MSSAINIVKLFRRTETETFYECRRCGTTVDGRTVSCPACDAEDIASYEL